MSNDISKIKEIVFNKLNSLEMHSKTTTRDLIDLVVSETGTKISIANGIVPMIIDEWEEAGFGTVELGRGGGVYRGGKSQRIDARPRCESCNQVLRKKTSDKTESDDSK